MDRPPDFSARVGPPERRGLRLERDREAPAPVSLPRLARLRRRHTSLALVALARPAAPRRLGVRIALSTCRPSPF